MRNQGLKRSLVVVLMAVAFCFAGVASAQAAAKSCTPFGCHPGQGSIVQELGGMIVAAGVITVAIYTFARGIVK